MRVVGIEITDHPGFGSMTLDFREADGRPARSVVLAGENGCGKTTVLHAIFMACAPVSNTGDFLQRIASFNSLILLDGPFPAKKSMGHALEDSQLLSQVRQRWTGFAGLVVQLCPAPPNQSPRLSSKIHFHEDGVDKVAPYGTMWSLFDNQIKCFLSEARTFSHIQKVEAVKGSSEPPPYMSMAYSQPNLANEVGQFLVDLKAADDAETVNWLENNPGRPPDDIRNRRFRRFSEAFSFISSEKTMSGVIVQNGEHVVNFKQGDFTTPFRGLSSGELHALVRGSFLIRSESQLEHAVILVDEPEVSLHPKWQTKILSFYEKISGLSESENSQIIVATHSPFVMHGSPASKHLVLRRDNGNHRVYADTNPTFVTASIAKAAISAFNLQDFKKDLRGNNLALIVEGKTDKALIECAWTRLRPGVPQPFTIVDGRSARGVQSLLGASEKGRAGPFLDAVRSLGVEKVVGLFDFDGEGHGQWNGSIRELDAEEFSYDLAECVSRKRLGELVWAALLPIPAHRVGYASLDKRLASKSLLTIELLFDDALIEGILTRQPVLGTSGVEILSANTPAQKASVVQAAAQFPPEAFGSFLPLFRFVEAVLAR